MALIDVIAQSKTDYEIYFLLTAYLESVRFGDNFRFLPDHITALPLNGPGDVRRRYEDLASELSGKPIQSGKTGVIIKEALDVFGTGLHQLTRLARDPQSSLDAAKSKLPPLNATTHESPARAVTGNIQN